MAHTETNGRTWAPVLSILALVTGVAAVVSPMGFGILNIDHENEKQETELKELAKSLETESKELRNSIADIRAELAAMRVQFAEVETQFKGAKEQLASVDTRIDLRQSALDKTLQQEIKNVSDINIILQANQKENIAAVQAANNRLTALETYLRFKAMQQAAPERVEK